MRSGHTATETQSRDNNVYDNCDGDGIDYYHSDFKDDHSDDHFCYLKDDHFDFKDDNSDYKLL